ncbi:cache domain-containing protein [Massilia oculi]|uniref:cache domain-containing protein n=1 Tax=Massilia oculi TaxID=945844 RepID=UPI0028AD3096|nr:cache domain-containing protein [Massilia oculi]
MDLLSARKLRRGLIALAIALPALFTASTVARIVQDYRSTLEQAESDMRNIATTLHEHAMRTFSEADTYLRMAIAEIEQRGFEAAPKYEAKLHEILLAKQTDSPLAASVGVLSPDGWILASAFRYPMRPVDARDRDYFIYLSAHNDRERYISRSVQSRLSGKWVIPVARRVNRPDGSLKMIVNFGIDREYFDRFYRNLQLGRSSRLLLVRRDGWVIMETPLTTGVIDRNLASTAPFLAANQPFVSAYETSHSSLDGSARVVGYASLAESPVIAVASMSRDQYYSPGSYAVGNSPALLPCPCFCSWACCVSCGCAWPISKRPGMVWRRVMSTWMPRVCASRSWSTASTALSGRPHCRISDSPTSVAMPGRSLATTRNSGSTTRISGPTGCARIQTAEGPIRR